MTGYDRSLYQSYLAQVPMFRSCAPEQLDRIADLGTAISAAAGRAIVSEGDPGEEFFVITSGAAAVERGGTEVAARRATSSASSRCSIPRRATRPCWRSRTFRW